MSNNKHAQVVDFTIPNWDKVTSASTTTVTMSNKKQTMKLYTEEQVRQMIEKSRETGLTAEYLILTTTPIELPSDEEIEIENGYNPTEMYDLGYLDGAKWMRDKIEEGKNDIHG